MDRKKEHHMGTTGTKSGKDGAGGTLSDADIVRVGMTAGVARELLQALTLKQALTGPSANRLLTSLSRALLASASTDVGKGKGKGPVPKSSSPDMAVASRAL
jgi:hypothetical protein